ncbi:unnamed protein product [Cuscuta campestris]|uniref:poly(A)-specific ribonuclease n=1 Tax=Cuscuta campestris TaxID=132261 RepID=A0A484NNM0_9ASTE|nr:unnamed protein product [Cuscuta campestris]
MASSAPLADPKSVTVREVWAHNLQSEFKIIEKVVDSYNYVSMDTEFPGVVFKQEGFPCPGGRRWRSAAEQYMLLKMNVDALNIIQIGLTLSDADGNLPDVCGNGGRCIWQFNFSDFDWERDLHSSDSIELLRRQGIDFEKNRKEGIDSARFGQLMMSSGLLFNQRVSWVTFHSAYDFGYVAKILTQRPLPNRLEDFLVILQTYFGTRVYDVKHLMRFCESLYGGLDRLAGALEVSRAVGKCHQAGSDSLLTWHVFQRMRDLRLVNGGLEKYAGVLYGLEVYGGMVY